MAMASSQTPGGSARAAAHHVSSTTGNRGAESPSTSPVAATPPAVSRVDHAATHATGTPVVGTELLRRFEVISRLGSGTYGHVYKLRRRSNGQICVLKQVPMAGLSAKDVKDTFNEAQVMSKIRHRHVIQYFESFIEHRRLNIVMEFAPGGDLAASVAKMKARGEHFTEEQLWDVLIGIAQGLQHIHRARILHRDIKPSNIFLDHKGRVKIGDFGLGRILGPQSSFATTAVGTPLYFSPELVEEKEYNERTDMWSLGCLMYELAALRPPFLATNHLALAKKIVHQTPDQLPRRYSRQFTFLISMLLTKDATKRPDATHVLNYAPIQTKVKLSLRDQEWEARWAAREKQVRIEARRSAQIAGALQARIAQLESALDETKRALEDSELARITAEGTCRTQAVQLRDVQGALSSTEARELAASTALAHHLESVRQASLAVSKKQKRISSAVQTTRTTACQTNAEPSEPVMRASSSSTSALVAWQQALGRSSDVLRRCASTLFAAPAMVVSPSQQEHVHASTASVQAVQDFVVAMRDVEAACRAAALQQARSTGPVSSAQRAPAPPVLLGKGRRVCGDGGGVSDAAGGGESKQAAAHRGTARPSPAAPHTTDSGAAVNATASSPHPTPLGVSGSPSAATASPPHPTPLGVSGSPSAATARTHTGAASLWSAPSATVAPHSQPSVFKPPPADSPPLACSPAAAKPRQQASCGSSKSGAGGGKAPNSRGSGHHTRRGLSPHHLALLVQRLKMSGSRPGGRPDLADTPDSAAAAPASPPLAFSPHDDGEGTSQRRELPLCRRLSFDGVEENAGRLKPQSQRPPLRLVHPPLDVVGVARPAAWQEDSSTAPGVDTTDWDSSPLSTSSSVRVPRGSPVLPMDSGTEVAAWD